MWWNTHYTNGEAISHQFIMLLDPPGAPQMGKLENIGNISQFPISLWAWQIVPYLSTFIFISTVFQRLTLHCECFTSATFLFPLWYWRQLKRMLNAWYFDHGDDKVSPCCLISYDADLGEACIEILDVLSPVPALPKLLLTRAHHLTIRNGLVIWTRSNGAPWVLLWRLGPFYDQRSPSEGIFTYLPYIFH